MNYGLLDCTTLQSPARISVKVISVKLYYTAPKASGAANESVTPNMQVQPKSFKNELACNAIMQSFGYQTVDRIVPHSSMEFEILDQAVLD